MNITYIFGNGFDKQMGLNTSYSDFIKEYVVINPDDSDEIVDFKNNIREQEKTGLWSDAEEAIGSYLGRFSDSNVDLYLRLKHDFEDSMRNYLLKQQDRCVYIKPEEINASFIDFILHSYSEVMNRKMNKVIESNNADLNFYFITFNYTDVIYRILDCIPHKTVMRQNGTKLVFNQAISVHGKLEEAPIFGVNDISQLDCSGGITITPEMRWNLIKPDINTESGYRYDVPGINIIRNSDVILFYGLSFGKTDAVWWKRIKNWLVQSEYHKIVIFEHDNEYINTHRAADELIAEKKYKTVFLSKIGFDESEDIYQRVYDQVFVVHNTTKLDMNHLIVPNSVLL